MECYFDNSATTRPTEKSVEAMINAVTDNYGNPSSLHEIGDRANRLLEESRKTVADFMRCKPGEVYFTASGTESNNMALFGAAMAMRGKGRKIVSTDLEHPSVTEPLNQLEQQGFQVVRLSADPETGSISEKALFDAIDENTVLVSMMLVNNETGSIQPVSSIRKAIRRKKSPALIHCDAVQAFGKIPVGLKELGVDLISVSSHKVHGPKGCGVLCVKDGVRIKPLILGGGQEQGLRSGTQAVPAIAGFAAAVKELDSIDENLKYVSELRNRFVNGLKNSSKSDAFYFNSKDEALPYIVNLSVKGVPSEVMRNQLSEHNIYVSTGSACSKGHRSPVLTSLNLPSEIIDSALRFSFSRFNTEEEIDYAVRCLEESVDRFSNI